MVGCLTRSETDEHADVFVPDECFAEMLSNLFDKFNFTVMESTPFDIEVAVDPEMLGKVFEELVTGRHDSGSYYTPRPVVSFMCREALKGYLEGQSLGLSAEAIAKFVDDHDASGITLAVAHSVGNALARITVVDPACGSGAYLLGMMQELVDLQTVLYNVGVDSKSLYELKLGIIQRNLYGVDIDEFAVNIAMLRLWLSLSIEYEGEKPEPLPNLDFKIVCGDSLLGPDPSPENYGDLFRHQVRTVADRLADLKDKHMRESGPEKAALKEQVEDVEDELRESLGDSPTDHEAVDWRVQFAEVFNRGGFDAVLAYPPYIQLQRNAGELGNLYKNKGFQTFWNTGDIYQLFYERGCQMLKRDRGLLAYITSNSWLKAEYGKVLRRYFVEHHTPLRLLDLGKDIFTSAIVDSCVFVLHEGVGANAFPAVDMDSVGTLHIPPPENLWGLIRPLSSEPWSVLSLLEQSVMDKMNGVGTPLGKWNVKFNYGIKTGFNKAFIIDETTREDLIHQDPNSVEILRPVLRGRDIRRYRAKWSKKWLVDTHNGYDEVKAIDVKHYPAVKAHLDRFYPRLEHRDRGKTPYNLRSCAYYKEFAKEKLFWIDLTEYGRFAYDDSNLFCANSAYMMTGASIKYLCAVLNAKLITWYMRNTALNSGMGTPRWVRFTVERLPIPQISSEMQRTFIVLVDEILKCKEADPSADTDAVESKIDQLVYRLYGLSEEEIVSVERSLAKGN